MDLLSDPDTISLQQAPSLSPIKAKGKPNMVSTNHDYLRFHHLYNLSGDIFVTPEPPKLLLQWGGLGSESSCIGSVTTPDRSVRPAPSHTLSVPVCA